MNTKMKQTGVSLIELMIGLAIIGVISAIAIPQYQDYVQITQESVMAENMNTIRLFQEEIRLSQGSYREGTYDPDDPNAAGGLTELIGWSPRTTDDEITYVVDDVDADGFQVTATHTNGTTVQRQYSRP